MITGRDQTLDPRAWLAWGIAATLPALLGRNPWPLVTALLAVLAVRGAWRRAAPRTAAWDGVIRLALLLAIIGVLFNLLTVRAGEWVIALVPEEIPLLGGPLTLNALIYGLLSGLALLTLVLAGTTVGAALDWLALVRLLPDRLTTVTVAGSVAWALVPGTVTALREIREAQAARGHRPRGVRDLIPLLVPLLTGALERAVTLAEALESRGFGAPLGARSRPAGRFGWEVAATFGLAAAAAGAYLIALGHRLAGLGALAAAGALLVGAGRGGTPAVRRTRYRPARWGGTDTLVAGMALIAAAVTMTRMAVEPAALRYEPYPSLALPQVDLLLLAGLMALTAPVFVVPKG